MYTVTWVAAMWNSNGYNGKVLERESVRLYLFPYDFVISSVERWSASWVRKGTGGLYSPYISK
jgi:hypothetical protein